MTAPRLARSTPVYTPWVDYDGDPEAGLALLVGDVAARLRPVCAHLPPAEFDALVRDIARRKLRWSAAERGRA